MFDMKKLSLRTMVSVLSLAAVCAAPAMAADKSVAVTAIVEHPALDAIRDGVKDELKAEGFETGKNLKWEYQSAQGNTGTAAQIARKFVGDKPDVIVAIATPSAQALVASTKTIPVVYSGVTDPIAAQLVKDWKASGVSGLGGVSAAPGAACSAGVFPVLSAASASVAVALSSVLAALAVVAMASVSLATGVAGCGFGWGRGLRLTAGLATGSDTGWVGAGGVRRLTLMVFSCSEAGAGTRIWRPPQLMTSRCSSTVTAISAVMRHSRGRRSDGAVVMASV